VLKLQKRIWIISQGYESDFEYLKSLVPKYAVDDVHEWILTHRTESEYIYDQHHLDYYNELIELIVRDIHKKTSIKIPFFNRYFDMARILPEWALNKYYLTPKPNLRCLTETY
jgi:hypothetical protein